jgi:Protein of unknown function (DUF3179)
MTSAGKGDIARDDWRSFRLHDTWARVQSMKARVVGVFLKLPLIVVGLVLPSLGASIVLTHRDPLTLPWRARRWIADNSAWWYAPPRKNTAFAPLVSFPVAAAQAAGPEVRDEQFVVGVELNGESRAYPLNVLYKLDRHVLDDTLGGQPIAVTWCGLCQSPAVYARRIASKTLTFFVSGNLRDDNMVMKNVETGSEWPQILGEAIKGPLEGQSLERIPSVWTDWKSWRTGHPDTTVAKLIQTVDDYRHDPESLSSQSEKEKRYFSSLQWGFVRAGKALSWPLKELARHPVVNDSFAGLPIVIIFESRSATISAFERRIGDTEPTFRLEADGLIDDQTRSIWDPVTGQAVVGKLAGTRLTPIAGIVSLLKAWRTFHPDSEVRTVLAR